jgi:hypothetical protein
MLTAGVQLQGEGGWCAHLRPSYGLAVGLVLTKTLT